MTEAVRRDPPRAASNASSVPSPPSASGTSDDRRRIRRSGGPAPSRPRPRRRRAIRGTCPDKQQHWAFILDRLNSVPDPSRGTSTCSNASRCSKRSWLTTRKSPDGEAIERIRALAEPFRGARVLHINATAYGGGVAELLATHVPLLRSLGIEAEWQVIHGSDEFFAVTKAVHNALQGADVPWNAHMQKVYLEKVLDNALLLDGEWDYVVVHDPQPAALLTFIGSLERQPARDEVDLALPHRPHRRARGRVGVLPPPRRALRRVGLDDGPVRARLAGDGQRSSSRRRASTRSR